MSNTNQPDMSVRKNLPTDSPAYAAFPLVRKVLRALIAEGYTITIDDGDGEQQKAPKLKDAMEIVFSVDDSLIIATKDGKQGWVQVLLCNGSDAVGNWTMDLDSIVDPLVCGD